MCPGVPGVSPGVCPGVSGVRGVQVCPPLSLLSLSLSPLPSPPLSPLLPVPLPPLPLSLSLPVGQPGRPGVYLRIVLDLPARPSALFIQIVQESKPRVSGFEHFGVRAHHSCDFLTSSWAVTCMHHRGGGIALATRAAQPAQPTRRRKRASTFALPRDGCSRDGEAHSRGQELSAPRKENVLEGRTRGVRTSRDEACW